MITKFYKNMVFSKSDIDILNKQIKRILTEQTEEYLSYFESEEKSLIERFFE